MSGAGILALLLVRWAVGATMLVHGLNHWRGGSRIEGTARWFSGLGLRHGRLQAWEPRRRSGSGQSRNRGGTCRWRLLLRGQRCCHPHRASAPGIVSAQSVTRPGPLPKG